MFIDKRELTISGGDGGDGIVHWHREKYIAKGGPDGGNGGDGGDVYLEAIRDIRVLEKYNNNVLLKAEDGVKGQKRERSGKNGSDITVRVPIGSIVINKETKEKFELLSEGEKVLIAAGGRGGLGNAHFKSSVNTTPDKCTNGEPAQKYDFTIELNIIADVGIIGLPNAGKSTLLNSITNSSANVASYPFTTIEPNLGVFHGYVLADIPGLIENASTGKGLGHKFLKHVSRTKILLHLVSADNEDVEKAYSTIRNELEKYDKDLAEKKEIVVLSKVDLIDEKDVKSILKKLPKGARSISVLDDSEMQDFSSFLSKELLKHL